MATADLTGAQPESPLAWERRQARPTAIAAFVAAIVLLVSQVLPSRIFSDFPTVGLLDGLRDALGRPLSGGQPGLRSQQVIYYADHGGGFILVAALIAVGYVGTGIVLAYLWRAASHRREDLPRWSLYVALLGTGLYAVGVLVAQIGIVLAASDFKSAADQSSEAARDALGGGLPSAAAVLQGIGALGTAVALVAVPLAAMRVGLLSRFMGILGAIAGALVIFRIGGPIVQCYWLAATGFLVLDRWPGPAGRPPAWETGEAMPWPSQQELREQRAAAAQGRPDGADEVPAPRREAERGSDPVDAAGITPVAQRTSRKRKRR